MEQKVSRKVNILTIFRKIGVQFFPKLTKNQNARYFAGNNGREPLLPWCVSYNEVLVHIPRLK